MGIYDRDYYRNEGPSYLEALIPSGQVCKWLIIINVVVFIFQMLPNASPEGRVRSRPVDPDVRSEPDVLHERVLRNQQPVRGTSFTEMFYLDPPKVITGQVWRLLTYAFLHEPSTWMHIFFNMLFLWWFGSELERMYGPKEFLAFYLCAALIGGLAAVGFYLISHDPTPGLGASGAVTALLVLFALHFPHQKIYVFFLLPVPIWLFAVFHVAQDTFDAFHPVRSFIPTAGIVHLSGAAFGFLYFRQHWHILGLLQTLTSWKLPRARPRLRLYRPENHEPVSVSTRAPSMLDEHLEAKLDAVLEKVARFGQSSLTEAERQILLKASEIYKRRRS